MKVGDKVIRVKQDRIVGEGTVVRVTPKTYRVAFDGEKETTVRAEPDAYNRREYGFDKHVPQSKWDDSYVVPVEQRMALEGRLAVLEAIAAEKIAARNRQLNAIAERKAKELAEARDAVGNLQSRIVFQDQLPDGSRFYLLDIPVQDAGRKGFERLIVRCMDDKEDLFGRERPDSVLACYTYANAESRSFSSVSGNRHRTDEEALWEAIRAEYHSW